MSCYSCFQCRRSPILKKDSGMYPKMIIRIRSAVFYFVPLVFISLRDFFPLFCISLRVFCSAIFYFFSLFCISLRVFSLWCFFIPLLFISLRVFIFFHGGFRLFQPFAPILEMHSEARLRPLSAQERRFSPRSTPVRNPATKLSPAPVESTTSTGSAGRWNFSSCPFT